MSKSIKKNYVYNLVYQIIVIIMPLITTPYLSRVLGAESIGIYSYTLSIATYFILFGSLGVALYGQRETAYNQANKYKRSKIFFEIVLLKIITLSISILIFYCTFCLNGEYSVYYKILLFEIIANMFDIAWFFQGIEEFKKTVTRNIIIKVISVISIFVFVKSKIDLNRYFLIYVLSNLIGNCSLWFYLPKYVEKVKIKELDILKHLRPTISLFIPQIAIQVYTVLDKTMIGVLTIDKAEVGYYEQAQKMLKLLLTIATSLSVVMIPRIASVFANGENEKLKRYISKSFRIILFLVFPIMFGIVSISNKFVPIFYGEGFEKVIYLICTISPIILAIGISNVIGNQYLLPTKQQKKFTISVTIGAAVNVCLNFLLIKKFKSIGASIATVISEFVVTGIQLYLTKNEIKLREIFRIGKNYFISSLAMFVISIIIGEIISNNIISLVMQIFIGGIVYIIFLIVLKDELIIEILNEIKIKIFSRKI